MRHRVKVYLEACLTCKWHIQLPNFRKETEIGLRSKAVFSSLLQNYIQFGLGGQINPDYYKSSLKLQS